MRAERSDGVENRQRILAAARVAVARDGVQVPLATVAAGAGVGIGTLYRHFPNRAALLDGLVVQSLRLVVDELRAAAAAATTGIEGVRGYLFRVIAVRDRLTLPLRGGPAVVSPEATALRAEIHRGLGELLARGSADGTIRAGVTSFDLILLATMVSQPLPGVTDWDRYAHRATGIYLAGLAPHDGRAMTADGLA